MIVGGSSDPICPPNASCVAATTCSATGRRTTRSSRTWTTIAPSPIPLSGTSVVVGDELYVLTSGYDGRPSAVPQLRRSGGSLAAAAGPGRLPPSVLVAAGGVRRGGELVRRERADPGRGLRPDVRHLDQAARRSARSEFRSGGGLDRARACCSSARNSSPIRERRSPPWSGWPCWPATAPSGADPSDLAPPDQLRELAAAAGQRGDRLASAGGRHQVVWPEIGSADGGEVSNWGRDFNFGGILDPADGRWRPLPEPPSGRGFEVDLELPLAVGDRVLVGGHLLEPVSLELDPAPTPAPARPDRSHHDRRPGLDLRLGRRDRVGRIWPTGYLLERDGSGRLRAQRLDVDAVERAAWR